jgi:hypothetical protein
VASIAAGDNAIGRVKLTDGTDVADVLDLSNSNPLTVAIVDGSGDQITSFGGGTQYTEDAAAAANPVGTAINLIRTDTPAGRTTTDGDNVAACGTDKGELYVKHVDALTVNSHAVTNAGTFAVQVDGAALTSLQLIDDVVYVDDADWTDDTSKHALVGGVYQSSPHTVTDGDVTPFLTDVNGRLVVAATDNGGSLTIDNAHLTSLGGAISGTEVQVDVVAALPAGNNNIGDVDVASLPTLPAGNNNIGDVDVASLPALPAGNNNIGDVDVASIAAGTNLIGKVASGLSTSEIYNGTTALTPAYATIDTATSGDNTIVDPGGGKKVRVLAINFVAVGTAVSVYFKTGSTAKLGSSSRPIVLDKTGATGPAGFNSGFCPVGWFEGAADENLVLNLSAAQGVIGNVVYVEV